MRAKGDAGAHRRRDVPDPLVGRGPSGVNPALPPGSVSPNGRSGVRALRDVVGRRAHRTKGSPRTTGVQGDVVLGDVAGEVTVGPAGHPRGALSPPKATWAAQWWGPQLDCGSRVVVHQGSPVRWLAAAMIPAVGLAAVVEYGFSCFTLAVLARQFLGGAIRTTLSSAPSRPSSADCWYSKGQSAVAVGAGGPVQRRRWRQASGSTCRYPSVHGRHRGTRKTGARRSCSADLAASGPTRLEAGGTSRRNVSCRVALTATDALGCWAERSRRTPRAHPQVDHLSSSERTSPMIFVVSCAGSGSPPSASATSAAKSSTEWTPPTRTWRNASPLASGSPAASTASATA